MSMILDQNLKMTTKTIVSGSSHQRRHRCISITVLVCQKLWIHSIKLHLLARSSSIAFTSKQGSKVIKKPKFKASFQEIIVLVMQFRKFA